MIKEIINISKKLLYDQPFYGSVLLSMNKQVSEKIPTACVGLQDIMYRLLINPNFWKTLNEKQQQGLLIHELGHIVNFHLTEYKHLENHDIANQAMDIYINQTIKDEMLPPGGCTWDKYEGLVKGMDTNWYYEKLMKNKEDGNDETLNNILEAIAGGQVQTTDKNGNPINVPDHGWEEVTGASEAMQKMASKNTQVMLSNIIKQLSSQPGNIPSDVKELLERLMTIEPPKFNWRGYVRTFVGVSTKSWTNKTRRKESKRFEGMPGLKEKFYSRILIGLDSSLSVSIENLEEFRKEIIHMYKTGHDVEIVICDTEIQDRFVFKPNIPFEVTGRGGTDFNPVVDLYVKNLRKFSCLIYLTDGEASPPKNARGNILWVHGTEHDINDELPGRKIKLN